MQEEKKQNFLSKYMDNHPDALSEIDKNDQYISKIIKLESFLYNSTRSLSENSNNIQMVLPEDKLLKMAEEFVEKRFSFFQEENKTEWQKILDHAPTLAYFQDMIKYISASEMDKIRTPIHFKNIINERLHEKEIKKENTILILIKKELKLISQGIKNLFPLPDILEPVSSRSEMDATNEFNPILQFIMEEKPGTILFQLIKDYTNKVSLTLRLFEFNRYPDFIHLKKGNRLAQSQPISNRIACFSGLEPDSYEIEMKSKKGTWSKKINIKILDELFKNNS